jgi:hypothetical protein
MQRIPILLLTISLALPALAQSPDVLLRAAIDKEQSDGDLRKFSIPAPPPAT